MLIMTGVCRNHRRLAPTKRYQEGIYDLDIIVKYFLGHS